MLTSDRSLLNVLVRTMKDRNSSYFYGWKKNIFELQSSWRIQMDLTNCAPFPARLVTVHTTTTLVCLSRSRLPGKTGDCTQYKHKLLWSLVEASRSCNSWMRRYYRTMFKPGLSWRPGWPGIGAQFSAALGCLRRQDHTGQQRRPPRIACCLCFCFASVIDFFIYFWTKDNRLLPTSK